MRPYGRALSRRNKVARFATIRTTASTVRRKSLEPLTVQAHIWIE
jgi:hypothetical protein